MNILLTKKLPASELALIRSWGWNAKTVETLNITTNEVREIPHSDVWVISSRNSLGAVRKFIDQAPGSIYCIGDWMKEQLNENNVTFSIKNFGNMEKLATELAKQEYKHILYYCGEEHRQELEEGLKGQSTKISKVITHRSEMTFPVVDVNFDVVCVFSPRSAESLLRNNSFANNVAFASIGTTTASYLSRRGITNIFTASNPDSRTLLEEFHNQILNPGN
jgi:uroporphyrinogen-III synthase